jgi:DNA-binding response OmpR family regulator
MKKILIIDDSRDLLNAMKIFLEAKGYLIKTNDSCKEILNDVKEFDPDLVILDVFLSGEDGREICKNLRRHTDTKHLCIILLSGSATALGNYKDYGADDSIEKPFDINILLKKIELVLNSCNEQKLEI